MDLTEREILEMIETELARADRIYEPFISVHEGYAILLEEIDELWDEIKKSKGRLASEKMVEESIQVAVVAVKFIRDLRRVKE